MTESRKVIAAEEIDSLLEKMAEAVAALPREGAGLALIGVRTHGVTLARRIVALLAERHGIEAPLGIVDITLYRDDLAHRPSQPIVRPTEIDFDVSDRTVVLVDDVLYTGRTIRSALDEIMDYGRPRAVRLAVLIDRGDRELPIQPDIFGKRVEAAPEERVELMLEESGEGGEAWILPDPAQSRH